MSQLLPFYDFDNNAIFYINGSLNSLHQAYNCRYNLSNIIIPGWKYYDPY